MDYFLITLSAVLIACQNAFNKLYQKNTQKGIRSTLIYPAIVSVFSVVLFLAMNGFSLKFGLFSFIVALIVSANSVWMMVINIFAFKEGSVSVCTMFMMLGGMLLPYLYGILFLSEEVTVTRIVGVLVLVGALVLSSFAQSGNEGEKKNSKKFYVYCLIMFVCNGFAGAISKFHQVRSTALPTFDYLVWVYALRCVFAFIVFAIVTLVLKRRAERASEELTPMFADRKRGTLAVIFSVGFAVTSGLGYFLQLIVAKTLDASLLFPFVTGGTIIFSTLMARIAFKEKISVKMWIALAIMLSGTILFVF